MQNRVAIYWLGMELQQTNISLLVPIASKINPMEPINECIPNRCYVSYTNTKHAQVKVFIGFDSNNNFKVYRNTMFNKQNLRKTPLYMPVFGRNTHVIIRALSGFSI